MNKRVQTIVAVLLAVIAVLALGSLIFLAFFFPKLIAAWFAAGKTLTTLERILSDASIFCKSYGLILLPLIMAGFAASVLWAVISARPATTKP